MSTKTYMIRLVAGLLLLCGMPAQAVENVVYFHNDALGSPAAITDAQGVVLWREAYEPYGQRLLKEGGHNQLWYTGKPEDGELGLSYFGARWYDPAVGRFHGMDPVGVDESNIHSFNRYAYANNNPYKFVDPDGRNPKLLLDFGLNVALNYATTGNANVLGAVRETVQGALNPLKTAQNIAKLGKVVTKGTKGLETRGIKPAPGERTIQGQVDAATQVGNPTVQRGGQDLFRLRSSGHGQSGATATPQNVRNVTPDGRVFTGKGPDRAVTPRDIRELYKAQTGQGTSSIRTRSGR